jgi:DNA-binding transcriptional regulator YiaG
MNPDHLFLGTRGDNAKDMIKKGRMPRGEHRAHVKLTEADVRFIRESNLTAARISETLGVSDSTVWKIRRREKWAHI